MKFEIVICPNLSTCSAIQKEKMERSVRNVIFCLVPLASARTMHFLHPLSTDYTLFFFFAAAAAGPLPRDLIIMELFVLFHPSQSIEPTLVGGGWGRRFWRIKNDDNSVGGTSVTPTRGSMYYVDLCLRLSLSLSHCRYRLTKGQKGVGASYIGSSFSSESKQSIEDTRGGEREKKKE